ncbi:MAG: hypothetical protein NOU37_09320 [Candidatus Brocadiales bacterium]|nr:hypothetical protein [Candidatus Bathyanammoxibius amoris]
MKTGIRYNSDNVILGIVQVTKDSDLELNIQEGENLIEVPNDHPILGEQSSWHIKPLGPTGISLRRKPQKIIDAETTKEKAEKDEQRKASEGQQPITLDLFLKEFNELRAAMGKPPITKEDALRQMNRGDK